MGLSKNTLDRSDISTYPIKLKYPSTYYSSSAYDSGITVNRGINTSFDSNPVEFLNYTLVKQLYYQEYITGSTLNSASYWDSSPQSTAAIGTFDNDYRYFPTGSGDEVTILAMPRTVFGENIGRKTLVISGSTYRLVDDGNGNVLDSLNSNIHVGNVLYYQGVVIITDVDYQNALIPVSETTTSTTTTTTTVAPTTTSTTTSTTTAEPTTTSTTTSTTTAEPTTTTTTTSTTSTTTTAVPTTTSTTTTTTTCGALPYSYTLYYDYDDSLPVVIGVSTTEAACTSLTNNFTVYSNSSTFAAGTALYYDACGTVPISATPYTSGQSYFNYNGNYVTFESNGYTVRTVTPCTTTTTTTTTTTSTTSTTSTSTTTTTTTAAPPTDTYVEWTVSGSLVAGAGGQLVIRDKTGAILVNYTSLNATVASGNITILNSNLPYSVTGSWTGGSTSENRVKYRICSLVSLSEIDFQENINSDTPNKYTLVPDPGTPISSSVFLTGGTAITPPACVAPTTTAAPIE